jgi:predicted nucleotidyltransferase
MGTSLNEYCARKLAAPVSGVLSTAVSPVLERAVSIFGRELDGVIVFGSWARGEAGDGSDVDVLVVVAPSVAIRRGVYDRWDAEPVEVDSRVVQVHIVHLPDPDRSISALWAEVALDGIVAFEKDREVSRTLSKIRRRIAAGDLVRRIAGGQPYWTEAA